MIGLPVAEKTSGKGFILATMARDRDNSSVVASADISVISMQNGGTGNCSTAFKWALIGVPVRMLACLTKVSLRLDARFHKARSRIIDVTAVV